jgi:hypothetical protein
VTEVKGSAARPLKVFVRYGTAAERISRSHAARDVPSSGHEREHAAAVGFKPRPGLNLHDRGGKIIKDLVYTNFFVGGTNWDPQDRSNIDSALAKAMSDQHLNNVLIQYFRGATNITTNFRPSTLLPGNAPASISQPEVEQLVLQLQSQGSLNGFDLGNTVFNFMLPRGVVLTIDDGSGQRRGGDTDEKASSLEGLGGFHGAVQSGSATITRLASSPRATMESRRSTNRGKTWSPRFTMS